MSDAIICPRCGFWDPDSWEVAKEQGEYENLPYTCRKCEQPILVSKSVVVSYRAQRTPLGSGEMCSRCKHKPATTHYGKDYPVCDNCNDALNREFEDDYS